MSTMRQDAQKQARKFCGRKAAKKRKTHPVQPEKGETGCVLGAGGDGNGCEQVRTDRKDRKARRNSWDGLVSAAASVGPGRSPPGCRPPRHAPQAGLRAHLAAKSYRTLTKKSGTAEAIPDFLCFLSKNDALGQKRGGKSRFYAGLGESHVVNHFTFQKRCGYRWEFIHWMATQVLVDHLSHILNELTPNHQLAPYDHSFLLESRMLYLH